MITIDQQIEEVERELRMRRQVYPGLVHSRKLRQSMADYQMARMEAVLATLSWCRDNRPLIAEIKSRGEPS